MVGQGHAQGLGWSGIGTWFRLGQVQGWARADAGFGLEHIQRLDWAGASVWAGAGTRV